MNSRERSVAAMRGLTPDRVPAMPLDAASIRASARCEGDLAFAGRGSRPENRQGLARPRSLQPARRAP